MNSNPVQHTKSDAFKAKQEGKDETTKTGDAQSTGNGSSGADVQAGQIQGGQPAPAPGE